MAFSHHDSTAAELGHHVAAERRGQPFLVYRDVERTQRLLILEGERVSVGREADNDLAFGWDSEASRVHAVLERLGGSWTVLDDDLSRNGTFVNGVRVRGRRRLSDHDVIRFGSTLVLYRDPGEEAGETAPAAHPATVAQVTPAQRRVLVALCRPLAQQVAAAPPSNREIADELVLSVEAVRSHLKTLFKLFEIPNLQQNTKRAELARRALASGIIALRDLSR